MCPLFCNACCKINRFLTLSVPSFYCEQQARKTCSDGKNRSSRTWLFSATFLAEMGKALIDDVGLGMKDEVLQA
ncbi:DUF3077 domain-containing protein [Pseudomonas sp. 910_21]